MPGSAPGKTAAQLFSPGDPWANPPAQFSRPAPDYYTDDHGNGYFLKDDASGSKMVFDDRAQKYWQQKWDALGKITGDGADGPGMGSFAPIAYDYAKMSGASDKVANLLASVGGLVDAGGAAFSSVEPYETTYAPRVEEGEWFPPVGSEATQLGGAHKDVKGLPGYEAHHMPAKSISPLSEGHGPSIAMAEADHRLTASHSNGSKAKAYRRLQADLIRQGDFRAARDMDVRDIQRKFGSKYDDAIQQMLKYSQDKGHW